MGGNTLAGRARHSRVSGPRQYCAHNCTHDVHGAGGEAHWGACRIEYEIQPKERDPKAASHRQFCHVTVHMDSSQLQTESNQLVLETDCGIFAKPAAHLLTANLTSTKQQRQRQNSSKCP